MRGRAKNNNTRVHVSGEECTVREELSSIIHVSVMLFAVYLQECHACKQEVNLLNSQS